MKLGALLLLVAASWTFQGMGTFAHAAGPTPPPGGTPPKPPPPPPPIAGTFDRVDPKHPGICFTKFDQQYPCAELPPPPPSGTNVQAPVVGGGRADDWDASKYNSGMYDELAAGDEYGALNQGTAMSQYNKVLFLCVNHNVSGRPDDLCTVTPTHPECTGLKQSLQYATNCDVPPPPGSPPGAACKGYGGQGYVIDEWLVFGEQYYAGMGGCLAAKEGADRANDRADRMGNLTDITSLGATVGGGEVERSGASTITGKTKALKLSSITKKLSEEIDDGAEVLGYDRGEIFSRALKGQPFATVFGESPFAGKLASSIKDSIDAAFGNAAEVKAKANEKRMAEVESIRAKKEAAGESTVAIDDALAKLKAPKGNEAIASLEKSARTPASTGVAKELEKLRTAPSKSWLALSVGADGQVKGSGLDAIAPANVPAAAASASPAATLEGTEGDIEASLFQRVRLSYRRLAPSMTAYSESKTARDIRLTDTPQFFRDL